MVIKRYNNCIHRVRPKERLVANIVESILHDDLNFKKYIEANIGLASRDLRYRIKNHRIDILNKYNDNEIATFALCTMYPISQSFIKSSLEFLMGLTTLVLNVPEEELLEREIEYLKREYNSTSNLGEAVAIGIMYDTLMHQDNIPIEDIYNVTSPKANINSKVISDMWNRLDALLAE